MLLAIFEAIHVQHVSREFGPDFGHPYSVMSTTTDELRSEYPTLSSIVDFLTSRLQATTRGPLRILKTKNLLLPSALRWIECLKAGEYQKLTHRLPFRPARRNYDMQLLFAGR